MTAMRRWMADLPRRVVVEQKIASYACVDSLQGVSLQKSSFHFRVLRGHGPKVRMGCFPSLTLMRTMRCLAFGDRQPMRWHSSRLAQCSPYSTAGHR